MKKLLFYITDLNGGGAEKVLVKIIEKLDKSKYSIDIFTILEDGIYLPKLQDRVIGSFYGKKLCNFSNKNYLTRKLMSLLRRFTWRKFIGSKEMINSKVRNNYDIEIAFLEGASTQIVSNRESKGRKIAWIHTDLKKHRTMSFEEEGKCYSKFDKVICVSDAAKESFDELYPEYSDRSVVVYNPVDTFEIREKAKESVTGFVKKRLTVTAVGRLSVEKGFDLLLKAHNTLIKEGLDYDLIIVGGGPLAGELQRYINENGIGEHTKLLGFQANPYPYIDMADIFVISSRYEGYSLVLAEAMTLNKPIISTRCTGATELLLDGEYGIVIPTESSEEIEKSLRNLLRSSQLRERYTELSKKRSSIINIDGVMKEIEEILDER